jgi:hypothetical protein
MPICKHGFDTVFGSKRGTNESKAEHRARTASRSVRPQIVPGTVLFFVSDSEFGEIPPPMVPVFSLDDCAGKYFEDDIEALVDTCHLLLNQRTRPAVAGFPATTSRIDFRGRNLELGSDKALALALSDHHDNYLEGISTF